eukprot:3211726-Rhodomonas_salina.2
MLICAVLLPAVRWPVLASARMLPAVRSLAMVIQCSSAAARLVHQQVRACATNRLEMQHNTETRATQLAPETQARVLRVLRFLCFVCAMSGTTRALPRPRFDINRPHADDTLRLSPRIPTSRSRCAGASKSRARAA